MAGGRKFKTVVFHLHDSDGYGRNNDKPFVVQALNNNSVQNQPGMEWTTSLLNVILHLRATCVRLRPPSRHRSTTTPCPFLLQWNNVLLRLHGPSASLSQHETFGGIQRESPMPSDPTHASSGECEGCVQSQQKAATNVKPTIWWLDPWCCRSRGAFRFNFRQVC